MRYFTKNEGSRIRYFTEKVFTLMGLTATKQKSSKISQKCSTITLTFYPNRIPSLRGGLGRGFFFFLAYLIHTRKSFPVFAITAITKISKWLVCNKLPRKF